MAAADLAYAFALPPERAIRYFESLGLTPPADWQQTWRKSRATAFAVANVHTQDASAELYNTLDDAIKQGLPQDQWQAMVRARFGGRGWSFEDGQVIERDSGILHAHALSEARLDTIYRTNTQSAYMAGRWQEIERSKKWMPHLEYHAVMDSRTRPSHAALNGRIYPVDDPFWNTFYPPNGFNCRCTVIQHSKKDLERMGREPASSADELVPVEQVVNRAGKTEHTTGLRLPDGTTFCADAGFGYHVGRAHLENLGQLQLSRAVELPPKLAATAIDQALKNPDVKQALNKHMRAFVASTFADRKQRGRMLYVGALKLDHLAALERHKIKPASAVIAINDNRLLHAIRDSKQTPLPREFWESLPNKVAAPDEIRLDTNREQNALFMVYRQEDRKDKLVITVDYQTRSANPQSGKKETLVMNMVNTGTIMDEGHLRSLNRYPLLWKKGNE